MIRYRIATLAVLIAAASLSTAFAQSATDKVAAAQREVLLQADQSWNGVPYTQYPKGRPQLTMLKLTSMNAAMKDELPVRGGAEQSARRGPGRRPAR